MDLIGIASTLFQSLRGIEELNEELIFKINNLEIIVASVIDGLKSYKNLSMQNETATLQQLREQIELSQTVADQLKTMAERGCITRLVCCQSTSSMIEEVEERIESLQLAKKALYEQVKMVNLGFIKGVNAQLIEINQLALEIFGEEGDALLFWRDYVKEKAEVIPVSKLVVYFTDFINDYNNNQLTNDTKLDVQNLDYILIELLDTNQDNLISIKEMNTFFKNFWDIESRRMTLNSMILNNIDSGQNIIEQDSDYKLIYQILLEIDKPILMKIFKQFNFNTKMLLSVKLETFMNIFNSYIDVQTLCIIFSKVSEINELMKYYKEIDDRTWDVVQQARSVYEEVCDALTLKKLKQVVKDNREFWIEDSQNGDGLCIMIIQESDDIVTKYYSRRQKFLTHRNPCTIIKYKKSTAQFQNVIHCYLNETQLYNQGFISYNFCTSELFYVGNSFRNYNNIDGKEKQFQISSQYSYPFKQLGMKLWATGGVLLPGGEFYAIDKNFNVHKQYYVEGKEQNWKSYKKLGIENKVNTNVLEQLKKQFMN